MANKKISELPYINGGEISGNTLVPLVTYFSATTGDTVHTYITDLQNYLTSGITGNTVVGDFLPLSGGTVSGQTFFTSGVTITGDTFINDTTGMIVIDTLNKSLHSSTGFVSLEWENRFLTDDTNWKAMEWSSTKRVLADFTGTTSTDFGNRRLIDSFNTIIVDWENSQINDSFGTQSIFWQARRTYDKLGQTSIDYDNRSLIKSSSDIVFNWENGILTGLTNTQSSTISATTYLNLPNGYYDTTGITSSQSITWEKTYWGISGSSNVDITLPSTTSKDGHILIIKDESGLAGSYRIRVTPLSGTIDGNTYIDMNINYMSLTFVARNNNWWII